MSHDLYLSFTLGDLTLANRMVMAPMTRNRAGEGNVPTELNAEYYRQRAGAGLIITEATQVSAEGVGYPATPGIHSDEQAAGWARVTNAVHGAGGRIFSQLWYCGRISHPSLLPNEQTPVAPSAIRPEGEAVTPQGMQPFVEPRELSVPEIGAIVDQYRQAARLARTAGFDGVEVHAANGYLPDQFLRDGSNRRSDEYGGSVTNRMRMLREVLDVVLEDWPANRVGIRLTPENSFNSMSDSAPFEHFSEIISSLNPYRLAYLHMLEGDMLSQQRSLDYRALRDLFDGVYMANQGYTRERAEQAISAGDCDLVAFGTPFLANPDLVERFRQQSPLNAPDMETFYGGDARGYTDYPTLTAAQS